MQLSAATRIPGANMETIYRLAAKAISSTGISAAATSTGIDHFCNHYPLSHFSLHLALGT